VTFNNITIISGGQSGVDRAALDFALENGIHCEGWCPLGRLAEDGIISNKYPLKQTATSKYEDRTRLNIEDSDGILILYKNEIDEGTLLVHKIAQEINKHVLTIKLPVDKLFNEEYLSGWITHNHISKLNIVGPRESSSNGVYKATYNFLKKLLS
jgi:hypothetical protein